MFSFFLFQKIQIKRVCILIICLSISYTMYRLEKIRNALLMKANRYEPICGPRIYALHIARIAADSL